MGNKTLIYKQKVQGSLQESTKHLKRLHDAFEALSEKFSFPLDSKNYQDILNDKQYLAYSDQIIFRFSKLQDCMGAKLFKSILLYQGENIDKPFLDILNQLEKMDIIEVDEWFEMRDLRNEIAHEYEDNDTSNVNILNTIYSLQKELQKTLNKISLLLKSNC